MTFNVKIGVNPISWTNDDLPSLGGEISLEQALMEGKKIGYQGFELGNKFPRDPILLDDVLRKYELECVSGWYSGHLASNSSLEEEIAAVKPHLKLLASNGSKVMVYGEVTNSIQGSSDPLYKRPRFLNELEWKKYSDKLTNFARFTLSHGVRLAYHHHMGAYVETPFDIERLMSLTGHEVGLLFDSGHIMFAGGDPLVVLKQHIHRICHIHCKDVRLSVMKMAQNRGWSFLQSVINGVFTVPGDGAIDFSNLICLLSQYDYNGWLVVEAEQDPVVAPSYQYAKMGYDHLYNLVGSSQTIESNGKII